MDDAGSTATDSIWIVEEPRGIRRMRFGPDGADLSAVALADPDHIVFPYVRTLVLALALRPALRRVLVLGLGGGTFPMFVRRSLPAVEVDAVDDSAAVVSAAEQCMGLVRSPELRVHVADARAFLAEARETWDLVVLDLFGRGDTPDRLRTRAFLEAVRARVAPGGLVAANLWSEDSSRPYRSALRTYEAVFPEVHVVIAPAEAGSRIVLAFPAPEGLTREGLVAAARAFDARLSRPLGLAAIADEGHQAPGALPRGGAPLEDTAD